MIRLSVKSDYNDLIALWKEAFGDEEEAIKLFLYSRYIPDNTVVAEENGRIVSMLFLLEGKLYIKRKQYSSYYLYAAATAKSERGRGIMAEMLAFAERTALNRKIDFICLKPAEESLYGYYSRFGYKSVFSYKTVRITDFKRFVSNEFYQSDSQNDTIENRYQVFYETDAFIWDNDAVDYAVKQHIFYGGNVLESCKGLCLYNVEDTKCNVKAFCFTPDYFNNFIYELISNNKIDEIDFDMPVSFYCDLGEAIIKTNGMALAVSEYAKSVIDYIRDAYLSLTLD